MANQLIENSGNDYISSSVPTSWAMEPCPPEWVVEVVKWTANGNALLMNGEQVVGGGDAMTG